MSTKLWAAEPLHAANTTLLNVSANIYFRPVNIFLTYFTSFQVRTFVVIDIT